MRCSLAWGKVTRPSLSPSHEVCCLRRLMSHESVSAFFQFLSLCLRLSFSRMDSTFLSSGDKSGLITIEGGRERREVRRLRTLAVEFSVARSGLGRGKSLLYLPRRRQSLMQFWQPSTLSTTDEILSWSLRRRRWRGKPFCCSGTPRIMMLNLLLSEIAGAVS